MHEAEVKPLSIRRLSQSRGPSPASKVNGLECSGLVGVAQASCMRGRENFEDRKLVGLGGNGRACADCHMPSEYFQLSPAAARTRFDAMKTLQGRMIRCSAQSTPMTSAGTGKAADDFANTTDERPHSESRFRSLAT